LIVISHSFFDTKEEAESAIFVIYNLFLNDKRVLDLAFLGTSMVSLEFYRFPRKSLGVKGKAIVPRARSQIHRETKMFPTK
jgi:hypothetical protein